MENDLEEVRVNMRSWLFGDNIRRVVVLDPAQLMTKMGTRNCWGDDPVHPLPAVYEELAKLVLSTVQQGQTREQARDGRLQAQPPHWRQPGLA